MEPSAISEGIDIDLFAVVSVDVMAIDFIDIDEVGITLVIT